MKTFKQFIRESVSHDDSYLNEKVPPELGTTPIPKGHIRLFHYTNSPESLSSIKKSRKLDIDKCQSDKCGDPTAIWGGENADSYKDMLAYNKPGVVEFSVPKEDFRDGPIYRSVEPHEIHHIHEPWHHWVRKFSSQPDTLKSIHSGENDEIIKELENGELDRYPHDKEMAKALNYIRKNKLGK